MAEVTREIVHDSASATKFLSWLALLLAIAALVLAWIAYNRSGQDLENKIQSQVNSSIDKLQGQTR